MQFLDALLNLLVSLGPYGVVGVVAVYILYRIIWKLPETKNTLFQFLALLPVDRFKRSASAAAVERVAIREIEALNQENQECFLPAGKLELRRQANDSDWEEEGKVFIVLRERQRVEENLLGFGLVYVQKYVLSDARPYLHPDVCAVVNAALLHKFLSGNTKALRLWDSSVFETSIKSVPTRLPVWDAAIKADETGLFTRLVLPEYRLMALRMARTHPTSRSMTESREFLVFIGDITGRERGDPDVPLVLIGQHIRASVVLVGQMEKLADTKLRAHVKAINIHLDNDAVDDVFIMAAGPFACWAATALVRLTFKDKKIERFSTHFYDITWRGTIGTPAVLVHYVKGVCIDDAAKKNQADEFERLVKSKVADPQLPDLRTVDAEPVNDWINRYGRKYFDDRHWRHMNRWASEKIASLMIRHGLLLEDLHEIFESSAAVDMLYELLNYNDIQYLHFYPEVLVRVMVFVQRPVEEWLDELNTELRNTGYTLEVPAGFDNDAARRLSAERTG